MIEVFADIEQNTPEWGALRAGIVTASELKSVIAKGEGKVRRSYMLRLAGERLTGVPAETYENHHMIRGREMEAEARALYAFAHDVEPQRVGFIRSGEVGCSPDSLLGDDAMLEVKTKLPALLIEAILRNDMPPEHRAQCQGSLWIAERERIAIACYWPGMPLFVHQATRDEAYIKNLAEEVDRFNAELAAIVEKVLRYGAPPVSLREQLAASRLLLPDEMEPVAP